MGEGIKKRREYLSVSAVDPETGKSIEILISYEKIIRVGKRSKGQALECKEIVPFALQKPVHIFEGLCRDEDEQSTGVPGWRCYCSLPSYAFEKDGNKVSPWPDEVFLVFVNEEKVAYNWYWVKSDKEDKTRPVDFNGRFLREVL